MRRKKVKVFLNKELNHYVVLLGSSLYEMNYHANMPNGVDIYLGELLPGEDLAEAFTPVELKDLPNGVRLAIEDRKQEV